jgi:hypothetical protein
LEQHLDQDVARSGYQICRLEAAATVSPTDSSASISATDMADSGRSPPSPRRFSSSSTFRVLAEAGAEAIERHLE